MPMVGQSKTGPSQAWGVPPGAAKSQNSLIPGGVLMVQTQEARGPHQLLEANRRNGRSATLQKLEQSRRKLKWEGPGHFQDNLCRGLASHTHLQPTWPMEVSPWHTQKGEREDASFYSFFSPQFCIFYS